MNCSVCNRFIEKKQGYYLVDDTPYCTGCRHKIARPASGPAMPGPEAGPDSLLKAFRAYQQSARKTACQRY